MSRFDDPKFIKWAKLVKERDGFTCQVCNKTGVYLNAHHKYSWDKFVDLRYKIDCGVTLCSKCHTFFHDIFGYGNNTEDQFNQYIVIYNTLSNIAKTFVK